MHGVRSAVLACALVVTSFAAEQSQQQTASPLRIFRTGVNVVPVYVGVTDQGNPVRDLSPGDFEILHDGQRVSIALFSHGAPAVALKLLFDDTERMKRHAGLARSAADSIVSSLGPYDRAGVGTFRRPASPFTQNRDVLREAVGISLQKLRPGTYSDFVPWAVGLNGATTQFDTSGRPISSLWHIPADDDKPKLPSDVRAIVVLSAGMEFVAPGFEHSGWTQKDEIANRLLREGYVVFGLGFEGASVDMSLKKLAEMSGGWFLSPKSDADLLPATGNLVANLHDRYLLGFVPPVEDGSDHRIDVRVNRLSVAVQSRKLYRAPKSDRR